jgi:hypothetical protein
MIDNITDDPDFILAEFRKHGERQNVTGTGFGAGEAFLRGVADGECLLSVQRNGIIDGRRDPVFL